MEDEKKYPTMPKEWINLVKPALSPPFDTGVGNLVDNLC